MSTDRADPNGGAIAPVDRVDANPGDTLEAILRVTADANGVSSYGLSVRFDEDGADELDLLSAVELLDATFDVDLGGTGPVSTTESGPGTPGELLSFAAGSTGPGAVSASFDVALMTFLVTANVSGGGADLTPGFFNPGVDGLFGSGGEDLGASAVLVGASVPEPTVLTLLGLSSLALARRVARRTA
jgi:hypothetical protein